MHRRGEPARVRPRGAVPRPERRMDGGRIGLFEELHDGERIGDQEVSRVEHRNAAGRRDLPPPRPVLVLDERDAPLLVGQTFDLEREESAHRPGRDVLLPDVENQFVVHGPEDAPTGGRGPEACFVRPSCLATPWGRLSPGAERGDGFSCIRSGSRTRGRSLSSS